jgi:hypothetical protein
MNLKNYLNHQVEEMLKYKWIRGVEMGHDPGEHAIQEWTEKYAKKYRTEYEQTLETIIDEITEKLMPQFESLICDDPECKAKKLIRSIVEEFTKAWAKEKAIHPDNRHLDEI